MHNILKWLQFRRYAINHRLLAKMGRRLRAGHRLLEPAVGVRLLPPQVRNGDMEKRSRTETSNQEPSSKNQTNLGLGFWNLGLPEG